MPMYGLEVVDGDDDDDEDGDDNPPDSVSFLLALSNT
jgi:hypothetical protein